MTDIIETHGPQGSAMEPVGRRPWKAPRLIDLDDSRAEGMTDAMGFTPNDKKYAPVEGTFGPNSTLAAPS